jgi:hypothetical protein
LTIRNTSNVTVASISNSGSFSCSSINSNSGLIQTTGNVRSRGLTIRNTLNADVATISNSGSFTCTSINSNSGLIQTTGDLQSRGLTIKNTSNVDVATISNSGSFSCSSIDATSGLIETTGDLQSRGLTIKNTSNLDVATISNIGVLACSTIEAALHSGLYYESNPTNSGTLTLGVFNTSGNIDILPNNTSGNINIGNATFLGTNTQKINIKRPLTINYLASASYDVLGGSAAISYGNFPIGSGSTKSVLSLTNIPTGIYLIFYSVSIEFTLTTKTFTLINYGITSSIDSFTTILGNCYDVERASQSRTAYTGVGNQPRFIETRCNTIAVSGPSVSIYLTFGSIYTPTAENLSVTGTMKLMRIG